MKKIDKFVDKINDKPLKKVFGEKFSWGLLILFGGVIWALVQLIRSILYFFN